MFVELQCRRSKEWASKWYPCLACVWTVSGDSVCMSKRMASVSGAYLSCNCIWTLNEYQNDCRVWSVSVLYFNSEWATEKHLCMGHLWAGDKFEWVTEWQPCLERIWTVSEVEICMSSRMTSVSGVYPYCNWDLNKWQNDFLVCCVSGLWNW